MALKAGYKGIKKYIADKLNQMNPWDSFATDAEIAAAVAPLISWDEAEGYVGKNKFKISFDEIVSINTSGTWSGRTYTRQNVSFTVNDDLSITINGTNSGSGFQFILHNRYTANNLLKAGKYIYTAEGSETSNFYVRFFTTRSDSSYVYGNIPDDGSEVVSDVLATDIQGAFINVNSNATINNVTVKVMIREASVSDSTYQPYLVSNTDLALNKADSSVIGNVETASASTHAYTVGQGFICDGQYRVAKGDGISIGDEITNSNSDIKPISQCLPQKGTFSKTTNASGIISFSSPSDNIISVIFDNSATIGFPYVRSGETENIGISVRSAIDLTAIASTAVSGTYYYI